MGTLPVLFVTQKTKPAPFGVSVTWKLREFQALALRAPQVGPGLCPPCWRGLGCPGRRSRLWGRLQRRWRVLFWRLARHHVLGEAFCHKHFQHFSILTSFFFLPSSRLESVVR